MIRNLILCMAMLSVITGIAQSTEEVLCTIDGENVYTSEFVSIYKKNQDLVIENETKDFEEYLNLFIEYKLKIKKAYELQLDTATVFQTELQKYKEQLMEPYLSNQEATEFLVKEAYQRTVNEVNASHILIRVAPDAKPKDTLLAYQKIVEIRNKIVGGMPFGEAAMQFSEDPSAKENNGNLGYFSAFSMVYSFENAAYNTAVGEVSLPFKSQFGYHILMVNDKRKSKGEVEVAHIMAKNDSVNVNSAKEKIDDIYQKLQQGGDFFKIAREHSDDLSSAKKGGLLPKFGSGRMIKLFDDVAFGLQNEGDYSKPFQSNFGWHILKLIKKYPIQSYETLKEPIANRIKNGNRSKFVEAALVEELEKQYTVKEYLNVLASFYDNKQAQKNSNQTILVIEEENIPAKDFYQFLQSHGNEQIGLAFERFKNNKIISYHKLHLEQTNPEFAKTFKEYKDGLMLFELLQNNIWKKSEDSLGLQTYYNKYKENYQWKKRAKLTIASCTALDQAKLVKKYLTDGLSTEQIKDTLNKGATIHVLFSSGIIEETSNKLPKDYNLEYGVSKVFEVKKNNYTIIKVDEIIPARIKSLAECKGAVTNDYQNYLEKNLVVSLKNEYHIKMNKKAVKKLKKEYQSL